MSAEPRGIEPDDRRAAAEAAQEPDGPLAASAALLAATLGYLREVLELAAAEARLAALSGVSMLVLVVVAAALLVVGWVFVAAVVAYALVALGLPWPAAGLLLAAAHVLAAYLLWRSAVKLSRTLTLPTLRRTVLPADE